MEDEINQLKNKHAQIMYSRAQEGFGDNNYYKKYMTHKSKQDQLKYDLSMLSRISGRSEIQSQDSPN